MKRGNLVRKGAAAAIASADASVSARAAIKQMSFEERMRRRVCTRGLREPGAAYSKRLEYNERISATCDHASIRERM